MNKIETLIKELCPNGVEKKELSQISRLTRGKVMSKQFLEENSGDFPVYSSQTRNRGEIGKISTYDFDGEYITWTTDGANAGTVFYRSGKFSITNVCGLIDITDNNLNIKYLYYILSISTKKYVSSGMGNPKLMSNVVGKIKIPIPPLEIQEEIVKILDKFTDYVTELTTELTLRQKQYNYYRDKLLSLEEDKNYQLVQLGTICEIGDGLHGTPKYNDFGDYYFINGNNILNGNIVIKESTKKVSIQDNLKLLKNLDESILISINGTIGNVAYYSGEKVVLGKSVAYLKVKSDNIDLSYLYYYLQTSFSKNYFEANLTGSTIKNLGLKALRGMNIILPSLDRQKKLVSILLKFNQISNDISTGLPKEIELRQKQYEYYRDKLLSFD